VLQGPVPKGTGFCFMGPDLGAAWLAGQTHSKYMSADQGEDAADIGGGAKD